MGHLGEKTEEQRRLIQSQAGVIFKRGVSHLTDMARRDAIMWFMMGIAQLLIGNALLADEGTSDWIAYMIQGTGGGTLALGLYFLLFLARNESEFSELYSKAEKTILTTDPASGRKRIVDDSSKPVKAAWYSIPVIITIFGMFQWLATLG